MPKFYMKQTQIACKLVIMKRYKGHIEAYIIYKSIATMEIGCKDARKGIRSNGHNITKNTKDLCSLQHHF
jgi:hypothetical protein